MLHQADPVVWLTNGQIEGGVVAVNLYVVTVKEAGTALTPREIVHREKANLQGTLGTP